MLHVCRYQVERDIFGIVFDWLAFLDARSSSLSVGIVFETWCRPAHAHLSHSEFLPVPKDQDNLFVSTSSLLLGDLRPCGAARIKASRHSSRTRVCLPQELQQYTRRVCGTRCALFTGLPGV